MAMPDMGKMLGPLPLGAWLAVIGGGLGIAYYTKQNQPPSEVVTDPDLMPEDVSGMPGVGVGGSGQWVPVGPSTPAPGNGEPVTNEEWAQKVQKAMMLGGYPPLTVASGIAKYLNEEVLSASEFTVVQQALRLHGPPPNPPKTPTQTQPPTSPPKPAPPKPKPVPKTGYTYHTISRGENIVSISNAYRTYRTDVLRSNYKGIKRADGSLGILVWEVGKYGIEGNVGKRLVIPNAIKNKW